MKIKKLFIGAVAILCMASMLSAKTTIRVTLQLPISHPLGKNWQDFKKIVEKESNGELQVQIFPSAQLYNDKQVPEAVGSGSVEAGSSSITRFVGSVPAVEAISLPFFFDDATHLKKALSNGSKMRNILDTQITKQTGVKILWWQAYGHNVYINNKEPIRLPSDLKNQKVRTYGKLLGWSVEAYGGIPTLMSGSKQFLAYQQGAVDVGTTGLTAVKSRKLYEVMKNVTLSYDSIIEFVAVINDKFFNSLSPKHQQIILNAANEVEQKLRHDIYANEENVAKELETKMNVIRLSKDERAKWVEASKPVYERFVQDTGDIGKQVIDAANAEK